MSSAWQRSGCVNGYGAGHKEDGGRVQPRGQEFTRHRWSREEDRALRSMLWKGLNDKAVARMLRRTAYAVGFRRRHLGLGRVGGRTTWTAKEDRMIRRLRKAGYTWFLVGRALGKSTSEVYRRAKAAHQEEKGGKE